MKLHKTFLSLEQIEQKACSWWVLIGLAAYFIWSMGEALKQ